MVKLLLSLILIFPGVMIAQEVRLWSPVNIITENSSKNQLDIIYSKQFEINTEVLQSKVREIKKSGSTIISIPHPNGGEIVFDIKQSNLLASALQEKHPEIQTFKGVNEKGEQIRIDINPNGMHATIYSENGDIYLDPESDGSNQYRSYFVSDERKTRSISDISCEQESISPTLFNQIQSRANSKNLGKRTSGEQLRKYRIAITAHESFTTRIGTDNALSSIVTILNRTTGVFENELAITFELVANNDQLIFTRGNPGPFNPNGNKVFISKENQTFLDEAIGSENYDIGHIFGGASAGDGGIAAFRSVCVSGRKATAATSLLFRADNLNTFIEVVLHEIGHQFGAFHTFTSANSCSFGVSQWNQRAAYELGSGSTIMSYAGLCGANNVVVTQDLYFHAVSIENMLDFIERETPCAELITTGNIPPSLNISESGFTIPINTPFVLRANASDENNDELSYNWEQFDQATKMEDRPYSIGTASAYTYRVAAYNSFGTSEYSNTSSVDGTKAFITLWEITGIDTISIGLNGNFEYDFTFSWLKDDEEIATGQHTSEDGPFESKFTSAGEYVLEISRAFPHFSSYPKAKLKDVTQWGSIEWLSMREIFRSWSGSSLSATDVPNLSNVKDMVFAFRDAPNFNGDLSNWDISNVTGLFQAFRDAKAFNSDISSWNVENVTNMGDILDGTAMSTENYDKLLISWSTQAVQNGVKLGARFQTYCEGATARQKLIDDFSWEIDDNGEKCPASTDILSFVLTNQTGEANINITAHIIAIEVAFGSDLSALTPNTSYRS